MYYGSGTVHRIASGWTLVSSGRRAYALTRWQHISAWNDVMAAILKVDL